MRLINTYQENITLYLDFTCPWCYIGWHNLLRAIENLSADRILPRLSYCSHELNVDIINPMPFDDYMKHRFGDYGSAKDWMQIVTQAGIDSELAINFSKITHIFNTKKLHRMLQALKDDTNALHQFLGLVFYHVILQGEVLDNAKKIYACTGFDYDKLLASRTENEWDQAIEKDLIHGGKAGVSGIPCYNFGTDYSLFGAQNEKGYRAMLDLMYQNAPSQDFQKDYRLGTLLETQ